MFSTRTVKHVHKDLSIQSCKRQGTAHGLTLPLCHRKKPGAETGLALTVAPEQRVWDRRKNKAYGTH